MRTTRGADMERDPERETDLARRFRAERAHDARSVPTFARVIARRNAGVPRRWLQPAVVLAAAAVVMVAGELWRRTATDAAAAIVLVPGQLRVPTDYLLDLAGAALSAGEVPSIGTIDWYPLAGSSGAGPATTGRRN